ncbi:Cleavage stimulation factor 64 [Oxytricha trifallax]|uniref:Cleavage stimulation factor 64 n=1 Tax=Oxytricha trifallax TaxID=1172189 RepID=A0A073IBC0_9SPIT|nr:Cleavage stimulation factor 64 [Oxytricha trifallax]
MHHSNQHHSLQTLVHSFPQSQSHYQIQAMPPQIQSQLAQQSSLQQAQKPPGSCIFVGNIPYDSSNKDLMDTLRMVGPFNLFRLKLDKDTHQPKGFGFVEYKDQDVASSALRNLNKHDLNKRELKVDFASDNKNGANLRQEEIRHRDSGEIITNMADNYKCLTGSTRMDYNTDEIMRNLSSKQELMLLQAVREVYERAERRDQQYFTSGNGVNSGKENSRDRASNNFNSSNSSTNNKPSHGSHSRSKSYSETERLIELLANNQPLLERLNEIVERQLNSSNNSSNPGSN